MKSIEQKIIELKNKMALLNICKKDSEIEIALNNLENEIKSYREIEIYKEDFTDVSWSYVTKNQDVKYITAYLNID